MNRLICAAITALLPTAAATAAEAKSPVDVSGDVRLRLEQDWDGRTESGSPRADRARARIRARLVANVDLGSGFTLNGRVRTGANNSQQSANITFADFDGNNVDVLDGGVDRYSLAWKGRRGGLEIGRMAFPFFTPNEYFWDGDASPMGVAANFAAPLSDSTTLKLSGGAFRLPAGFDGYSGTLAAVQMVAEAKPALLAAGIFRFAAALDDPDRLLLPDNNGSRDYDVLAINAQYRTRAEGKPLAFNIDVYRNLRGYSGDGDPISRANADQRTVYVLSATLGDTADRGDFQLGYRYFHMEKLAVNASYANDDVARFGSGPQATLTDVKGHDLFANYAVTGNLTVGVRTMFVRRITNAEKGNRARFDVIYAF